MKPTKMMPGGGHLRRMMQMGGAMDPQGQPSLEQQAQMITNQILDQVGPSVNQRANFFMGNSQGDFQRLRQTPTLSYEDFEREVVDGKDQMNAMLYQAVLRALNNPNSEESFQLKRMLDMHNIQMGRGGAMEYSYGGKVTAKEGGLFNALVKKMGKEEAHRAVDRAQ